MLKVGLTGGIGCGKSHILREFHKLGVYTIDADEIAHEVILPDQPAYGEILETFGPEILAPDQTIDRKKLGERVFSDERERGKLNQIVHPLVLQEEARRIADFEDLQDPKSPIIMVDAALMIETGSYRKYDFVVVVYCHTQVQLQRVMARDKLSEEEALQRIQSQLPLLEKIKYADYVIENSGRLSETNEQVKHTFTELVNLGGELIA
jgi:dephospho-CoA kinase